MRPGVTATYALQAHRIEVGASSIDVLAATKRVQHRGDTLNAATLDVSLDSPIPGVIRVRVRHHGGGATPLRFPLDEQTPGVVLSRDDTGAELTSGGLTARVAAGEWNLEFRSGERLLGHQRARSIAVMDVDGTRHLSVQFSLGVGEQVYGLGERFTPFVKNGQSIDSWNEDGGTSSEQAYKNVPFYLTNHGYGILVNHTGRVSFEVGSEAVERVQFSVQAEQVEYLVIHGPSPKEILERYTQLTGRPPVPPHWSFGLWLSTSFVTDYDETTVRGFITAMKEREIPLSVVHFDCFWMREFQWCDFEWDPRTFPDPAGMLARIKADGLRVCVWINPYIAQASPLFDEAKQHGYLLRRPDGSVWQWDLWQAGNGVVDFTNPGARQWFQSKLQPLLAMGVDCFKTDFGERIPTDVVYHDGSDPEQLHNLYTQLYNRTVHDLLEQHSPGEAFVFARSATVGGQTMPVHWGGDNTATFESMAESLRGGLSLCLSGFGFWSHDIGGFEGLPDPAVFKRWVAFGLLSSHSRLHGNESVRVPWEFDEEAVAITRAFTRLKLRLMPYLYAAAHQAAERGWPMMRAMVLEFPQDRTCLHLDQQYLLGDSLLVAPVFSAEGDVEFYLPAGQWTHLLTGEVIQGSVWASGQYGYDSLPLFVREGSIIVTGSRDDTTDYDYQDDVTVTVYQLAEGATATTTVHTPGEPPITFTARREAGRPIVSSSGPKRFTVATA